MIIAFPSKPSSHGGPGSFQLKFENYLKQIGWQIVYPEDKIKPDFIIILGATRKLFWLIKMKMHGAKIYYRVGGINWLYNFKTLPLKNRLIFDIQIFFIPLIQKLIANGIIYQSEFSKEWLLKLGQTAKIRKSKIIFNSVNLEVFKPTKTAKKGEISLLCIEGNIDYTPYSIELINYLQVYLIEKTELKSLIVYGSFENEANNKKINKNVEYRGVVSRNEIQNVYKNAIYLSLDINAACPNTVIEALACGIPVIGYDTGALKELVPPIAGEIVEYDGDPWKIDKPDFNKIIEAANKVYNNYEYYSENARKVAEERYDINLMVKKYLDFINNETN